METKGNYCLNLGCGSRYLPNWVNIDFVSSSEMVIAHDLTQGIPFEDHSFDFVYHSHILEHFDRMTGRFFLEECYRVLKPGGMIRVVVPDLERIAASYLQELSDAKKGDKGAAERYQWAVIELLDQLVREQSGGEMLQFWRQDDMPAVDFVQERVGDEFLSFPKQVNLEAANLVKPKGLTIKSKIKTGIKLLRNRLVEILMRDRYALHKMQLGAFRKHGEVHKWMYDDYALGLLLTDIGFSDPQKIDAFTSSYPNWKDCMYLDVENNSVRKPDSLFMEARK